MASGGKAPYPGLRLVQIMMGVVEGSVSVAWPPDVYAPIK